MYYVKREKIQLTYHYLHLQPRQNSPNHHHHPNRTSLTIFEVLRDVKLVVIEW